MENKQTEKSQAELYRDERKQRMAKAAKKTAKKNPQASKIGKIVGKVVGIVIIVAVCLLVVYGCLSFFGVPQKVLTATKVGDQKVSVAKYNYYYMDIYLDTYNKAYQYDNNYGSGYGKMYTGYDYTKLPTAQDYSGTLDGYTGSGTPTYADYFRLSTLNYIQSYLSYADLARKEGDTLTDAQQQEIEDQISQLTTTASNNDYSLNRYLTKMYGKGVNEKLLREVYEERYLAYNYATAKQQEFTATVTDDQILSEFNSNIQKYTTCSVSLFKVKADTSSATTDDAKAAAMAAAKTTADSYLAKVTSAATLVSQAQSYDSSLTESSVSYTGLAGSSISSYYGSAVTDWIYDSARAVGNKAVIEVSDGYVVIYLTALPARDTTKGVNVRHILIKFDTSSNSSSSSTSSTTTVSDAEKQAYYQKAQSIYNEYLANPTEDNFASLANTYSDDTGSNTNGGLYQDVGKGDMVTAFNDWIFDSSRKPGDTGIIESTYGYHVMYYVNNDNLEAWKKSCKTAIATDEFTNFDDSVTKGDTYTIKTNTKISDWAAGELEKIITQQYINYNKSK